MPGKGIAPKDPSSRARRNADPVPMRILPKLVAEQPELPDFDVVVRWRDKESGTLLSEVVPYAWAEQTRVWWRMWADSALAVDFTSTDWSELLDTAVLHSEFWNGNFKLAGELRLRVAKFGATPEDRARLRITFAQADEAEVSAVRRVSSRDRMQGIRKAGE